MQIIFTKHAIGRLKKRKITLEEAEFAIKNPDKTRKEEGKYLSSKNIGRAKIEVVYEKDKYINVLTVYYI